MLKGGVPYNPIRIVPTTKIAVTPAARKLAMREIPSKTVMSDDGEEGIEVGASSAGSKDVPTVSGQSWYKPMNVSGKSTTMEKGPRSSSPSWRSGEEQRKPPWKRR